MRHHAELNYHISAMGGGKSLSLMVAAHQLDSKVPVLITKPASDLKAGDHVETRLGETRREVDFLIEKDSDIETLVAARMQVIRIGLGERAAGRLPFVFVDEGQFLLPDHVEQMRALADSDAANFEVYGLLTDFRAQYFPGSDALIRNADHISMANREIEHLCEDDECTRIALRNTRLIEGTVVRDGPQIAIDGIDATYKAFCSKHYNAG